MGTMAVRTAAPHFGEGMRAPSFMGRGAACCRVETVVFVYVVETCVAGVYGSRAAEGVDCANY